MLLVIDLGNYNSKGSRSLHEKNMKIIMLFLDGFSGIGMMDYECMRIILWLLIRRTKRIEYVKARSRT